MRTFDDVTIITEGKIESLYIAHQAPEEAEITNTLRIIRTARTAEAINQAVDEGFWPLIKPLVPNPKLFSEFSIVQNTETGKIEELSDYNSGGSFGRLATSVIPTTTFYPYRFNNPYAAYLIPSDLEVGEKVYLTDLIEDILDERWKHVNIRLNSSEAIWNGKDFELDIKLPNEHIY